MQDSLKGCIYRVANLEDNGMCNLSIGTREVFSPTQSTSVSIGLFESG